MENTEEKKQKSYKLFWSGEEISVDYLAKYYENELDAIIDENLLLGNFNSSGKYFFSNEVKRGLIAIKKKIEDKVNNSYFIVSKTVKNVYTFKMKIVDVQDDSLLAANLYLIEIVDDERFQKPLKTFIAQYVDKKNDEFINKAKYIFNISVDGEFNSFEKNTNHEILTPVMPKKKKLEGKTLEQLAKDYVESLLIELEKCGDVGKNILKMFKEETEVKEGQEPLSYLQLKKKLDALIEKHSSLAKLIKENPQLAEVIKNYNEAFELEKKRLDVAEAYAETLPDVKKDDKSSDKAPNKGTANKKPASKAGGKAGGSKSAGGGGKGGKGKGGGGGGKKDKKKEKKKDPPYKNAVPPQKIEIKVKLSTTTKVGPAKVSTKTPAEKVIIIPTKDPTTKTPKVIQNNNFGNVVPPAVTPTPSAFSDDDIALERTPQDFAIEAEEAMEREIDNTSTRQQDLPEGTLEALMQGRMMAEENISAHNAASVPPAATVASPNRDDERVF